MASKKKHMERSHRSHHNPKPFAHFEHNAVSAAHNKEKTASLIERMKAFFHRMTSK